MTMIGRVPVHPLADVFPLIEGAEFDALVADIRENDLQQPVLIWRGAVIDGRNRLRALIALAPHRADMDASDLVTSGLAIDVSGWILSDLRLRLISLNLRRRHLDESQRALVAARLVRAGERGPAPDDARADLHADAPCEAGGITAPAAAGLLNVSERLVKAAKTLTREAPAPVLEDVARGAVAVSAASAVLAKARALVQPGASEEDLLAAYRAMEADIAKSREAAWRARVEEKKARRAAREAALAGRIEAANAALAAPAKRYGVILADPEWRFETWSAGGMDRSAENHYPCSPLEAIAARPVANLAAEDCVLFLWATAPMLPEALAVMAAWGFTYRTNIVWDKMREGTGYWVRNRHEHLLIGVRGSPPAPAMGTQWASVLEAMSTEHSAKPEAGYRLIEDYFPTIPKIELNARAARPGWDLWGAEAPEGGL